MLKSIYVFMFGLLTSLLHSAGAPVYIVGLQVGNTSDATLWITDATGSLPKAVVLGNQTNDSYAISLTSIKNKLYCLGQQNNGTEDKVTLWITDTTGSSLQAVTLNDLVVNDSIKYAKITSFNNKIFCPVLNASNQAALLLFDSLNQNQSITTLSTNPSLATQVIHANNKIYIGGFVESGNQYATLWITDDSGQILEVVTLDDTPESLVTALTAANNKIYCVGAIDNQPTLWITDIDGSNTSKISLENVVNDPTAITVKNGLLYILSFQENTTDTLSITILDASGTLIKSVPLGGTDGTSIQSFGNQILAVGAQETQANPTATLWVTDTTGSSVSSYTIAPSPSFGSGIYTPQQETPTFYQALQKFSPVHFQKGI